MRLETRLSALVRATGIVDREDTDVNDFVTACAAGIAPLFFLTVRSWTNGFLLVLLVLAIHGLIRRPEEFGEFLADRRVRWVLIALTSAFFAILVSQVLRLEIETPAYDGPARTLAAGLVFLHLASRRIDVSRMFQWSIPVAVLLTAVVLGVNQKPFETWGGRWATYFVDPLTLGQYTLLLGFLSLFSINLVGKDGIAAITLKTAAFLVGVGISVGSASRSGWVPLPALFAIWLLVIMRVRHIVTIVFGFAALTAACALAYVFINVVHVRIDNALSDYVAYFNGDSLDSSGGTRLSLVRACWHLFLREPLRGYGDGAFPPLQSIPAIRDFYSETLEFALNHNGAHNEIMQNMVRSGVFGLVSALLMFIVPLVLFWQAARSGSERARPAAVIGLSYIVALICFSINTETFNLKYLASFYGLMVASLGAQIIWADRRPKPRIMSA